MSSPIEKMIDESCEKINNVEGMDDMMNAIIELVNKAIEWRKIEPANSNDLMLIKAIDKIIELGW